MKHILLATTATCLLVASSPAEAAGWWKAPIKAFRTLFFGSSAETNNAKARAKPREDRERAPQGAFGQGRRAMPYKRPAPVFKPQPIEKEPILENATATYPRILFLPGGGKNWNVPRLLAKGIKAAGIEGVEIVGLHGSPAQVAAEIAASDSPVVIAGHSMGGVDAHRLAQQDHRGKLAGAMLFNAAGVTVDQHMPVPTIVFKGSIDGDPTRHQRAAEGKKNVHVVPVDGGDHTMRFYPERGPDKDKRKDQAMARPETAALNKLIAGAVEQGLDSLMAGNQNYRQIAPIALPADSITLFPPLPPAATPKPLSWGSPPETD